MLGAGKNKDEPFIPFDILEGSLFAILIDSPCSGPVIAANDHRRHVVVEITKGHALDQLRIGGRRLDPDLLADIAPGKILQQVERPGQNVVRRNRLEPTRLSE